MRSLKAVRHIRSETTNVTGVTGSADMYDVSVAASSILFSFCDQIKKFLLVSHPTGKVKNSISFCSLVYNFKLDRGPIGEAHTR
jgi:hypothetical protein